MKRKWHGVFPAATTQFGNDQSLDLEATAIHLAHLVESGVHGLVVLGTVGENTSLTVDEKQQVLATAVEVSGGSIPVLAGVAEFTTAAAARFAADAEQLGADGLMVLPAMVYKSDARETMAHYRAVAGASGLPVMCYNNPVSYGVDISPEMFAELADEETLVAIKESSDDIRRITDLVNLVGDRYVLFGGVDDLALESIMLGADGLVSGMVNAFPEETLRMWGLAKAGKFEEARAIYRWFMPILHFDTHVKLVQYIKLTMAECGLGSEMVRAPRLPLVGEEREQVLGIVRRTLESRPGV